MYQHDSQAATELEEVPARYLRCLLHSVKCWASPREDWFCRPTLLPYLLILTNTPGFSCWRGGPGVLSPPGRMLMTMNIWYHLHPCQRTLPSWVPWEDDAQWSLLLQAPFSPVVSDATSSKKPSVICFKRGLLVYSSSISQIGFFFILFGICGIKICKSMSSHLLCSFKARSITYSSFVPPASGTC